MKSSKIKILLSSMLAAALLAGCSSGTAGQDEENAVPVQVAQTVRGDLNQTLEIVGIAKAEKEYSVYAGGAKLAKLYVSEGEAVSEGQLLAELDDRDVRLALEMERASLELTRNQYETAVSRLRQAELNAKQTILQTGRMDEQLEETVRQAVLGVEQAEQNLRLAELRVRQAEDRLQDTRIESPGDGFVADISVLVGEMVSAQLPLFTIVSDRTLVVEAPVSEDQLSLFAEGETLGVVFPATGETRTGKVRKLPVTAGQSGLYKVELTVENGDRSIKPGTPAKIALVRTLVRNTLLVPTDAVLETSQGAHLFVVKEDRAVKIPVEILQAQTDLTAVSGELEEGALVVVRGQYTLADGNRVSVVEGGQ